MKVGKVNADQLVALGRLLSDGDHANVDHVELNGTQVSAQVARDAFVQHDLKTNATSQGKVTRMIDKITAKADHAQEKLMRNSVLRFILDRVKPAEDLVHTAKVQLHYADGKEQNVDLAFTDTAFNRGMHKLAIAVGLTGLIPYVSLVAFVGIAAAASVAAVIAKASGKPENAQMLWHAAQSNAFRALGSAIPIAGDLIEVAVVAMEVKAEKTLTRSPSVNDMLNLKASVAPA